MIMPAYDFFPHGHNDISGDQLTQIDCVEVMVTVSLRARWLGRRLRGLRDDQGLTLKFVAPHVGVDFSALARVERGEGALTREHVMALLDVYRVHDPQERGAVVELAQQVWQSRGQVDFDGAVPDDGFADVLWLESQACRIQCYSPTALPDLLHSGDHAERAARAGLDDAASPEQVTARVQLARQRCQVWAREPEPPTLLVVVDEPAVRHLGAMERDHLSGLTASPNISLRVLLVDSARPSDLDHGFTVFTLPPPYPGPVVHIPYLDGRLLLERPHAGQYLAAFDALHRTAVDGTEFLQHTDNR